MLLYEDAWGSVAIAVNRGDAAKALGVHRDAEVRLEAPMIGLPHVHHRTTDSTNARARELAAAGRPHGTLVTADEQTAGRGRQGRTWLAAPGEALLMSVVVRDVTSRPCRWRPRSPWPRPATPWRRSRRGSSGRTTSGSTAAR